MIGLKIDAQNSVRKVTGEEGKLIQNIVWDYHKRNVLSFAICFS